MRLPLHLSLSAVYSMGMFGSDRTFVGYNLSLVVESCKFQFLSGLLFAKRCHFPSIMQIDFTDTSMFLRAWSNDALEPLLI